MKKILPRGGKSRARAGAVGGRLPTEGTETPTAENLKYGGKPELGGFIGFRFEQIGHEGENIFHSCAQRVACQA